MKAVCCLLFLFSTCFAQEHYCFFSAPKEWKMADPKQLASRVKIGFLGEGKKGICPSLNLAEEKTPLSLPDYLKAVKAIHESNPSNTWRALGTIQTRAGLAQLTEIDTKTEMGPIRLLQMIFLKEGTAYILTAGALREEFAEHYQQFQNAFRSFTLTSDPIAEIPQTEQREFLREAQKNLLQQTSDWIPFQQLVIERFADMGAYWQVQCLRSTQDLIKDKKNDAPKSPNT